MPDEFKDRQGKRSWSTVPDPGQPISSSTVVFPRWKQAPLIDLLGKMDKPAIIKDREPQYEQIGHYGNTKDLGGGKGVRDLLTLEEWTDIQAET